MQFKAPPWITEFAPGQELVLATRNQHKLGEFARILAPTPWHVLAQDAAGFSGDVDEPFDDYSKNAAHKAKTVAEFLGRAVIADDSGIEIGALENWPGPHSARWLGDDKSDSDRLAALLERVQAEAGGDRRARYVAAVALAVPGSEVVVATGTVEGSIAPPSGRSGFGYDPSFFSPELGKTFADATAAEKDLVSHRARAVRALASTALGVTWEHD